MSNRRNPSYTAQLLRLGGEDAGRLLLGNKGHGRAVTAWIIIAIVLTGCLFFNWIAIFPVVGGIGFAIACTGKHTATSRVLIVVTVLTASISAGFFWWNFFTRFNFEPGDPPLPAAAAATWGWIALGIFLFSIALILGVGIWARNRAGR